MRPSITLDNTSERVLNTGLRHFSLDVQTGCFSSITGNVVNNSVRREEKTKDGCNVPPSDSRSLDYKLIRPRLN